MNYRATIGHHAAYKESGHVEKRELLLFDCANSYVLQMYIVLGRIQNRRRIYHRKTILFHLFRFERGVD